MGETDTVKNRAASPRRRHVARTALPLIATLSLVGACDSAVGISPDRPDPQSGADAPSTSQAATQAGTAQAAAPDPATPPGPAVGEAPGNPDAAAALRPFVADLAASGIGVVTTRCWTIPPTDIPTMYSDTDAIVAAVAAPGVDGQYAVTWSGPTATVSIKRSEIASGYACPTVYPTGTAPMFDATDAAYTVDRYLARMAGTPINRADVEEDYPLVCDARPIWDPLGAGAPTSPPLATDPGILGGITSYDPDSIFVTAQNDIYTEVNADIVDAAAGYQNRTFALAVGGEGYCIGDIT